MADTEAAERIVTLTALAEEMTRKYLAEEEDPAGKVLRLSVTSGGCSGFQYSVAIDRKKEGDVVQTHQGFEAVVDPVSARLLEGATLDYIDQVDQPGYRFDNPQAKNSCGCGNSFDV